MHESSVSNVESIDDVIDRLTQIIDLSKANGSRLGYFASLYRTVTKAVKEKIERGDYFDDDDVVERLDVVFAQRYFKALDRYLQRQPPTASWLVAFDAAQRWWPIVIQHLLLGINAHINLDLGVSAAQVAPGDRLPALHDDFNRINALLASLVDEVRDDLAQIWPTLEFFNRFLSREQDVLINFSLKKARDHAWLVAQRLVSLDESAQASEIDRLDKEVARRARLILRPGLFTGSILRLARLYERGSTIEIIELLSSP